MTSELRNSGRRRVKLIGFKQLPTLIKPPPKVRSIYVGQQFPDPVKRRRRAHYDVWLHDSLGSGIRNEDVGVRC